jgi:hypothetical protein
MLLGERLPMTPAAASVRCAPAWTSVSFECDELGQEAKLQTMGEGPLTFRGIGTVGQLGNLYKFTPLDPFALS